MASYTVQLRKIIETVGEDEVLSWFQDYDLSNYLSMNEIKTITDRGTWSPARLAQKIIDHYYMREIGFETVGLFKRKVKMKMQEIMEDYLPVIYTASLEYDPLINVNYTETYTGENTSENIENIFTELCSTVPGLVIPKCSKIIPIAIEYIM